MLQVNFFPGVSCFINLSGQAVMQGWLYKRGKIRKSWKRRFFVLRGTRLEYFKSVTVMCPAYFDAPFRAERCSFLPQGD